MGDPRETAYLRQALALDPRTEAEALLSCRREYLQPAAVVVAELADRGTDDGDLRTRMRQRLLALRRAFWRMEARELAERLSALETVAHPETVTAAARLRHVAAQREAIRRLAAEPGLHPAFLKTFTEILVASPAEANRLREREHRHMRPEQNPHYDAARSALQRAAYVIRSKYPGVFELEQAWLTEVLEYNPIEETEAQSTNILFGLGVVAGLLVTLAALVKTVVWIFS